MALTPALFSVAGTPPVSESAQTAAPLEKVQAFENALTRQRVEPAVEASEVSAATPTTQAAAADLDDQSRARRGLGLEPADVPPGTETKGDMILDGLERLRGVFDVREAHISELMTRTSLDAGTMMAMQMEVANFTLLVDMTSKLTGKSTQAFDTLMKGQ